MCQENQMICLLPKKQNKLKLFLLSRCQIIFLSGQHEQIVIRLQYACRWFSINSCYLFYVFASPSIVNPIRSNKHKCMTVKKKSLSDIVIDCCGCICICKIWQLFKNGSLVRVCSNDDAITYFLCFVLVTHTLPVSVYVVEYDACTNVTRQSLPVS